MPAAGSLPARTRRNVTPKSMSSQSHARCARPTPRPARGPVATAARPSDNRARDGRWPSGASAGGPRNRPMPQVYASCSLRRRGSIFSPPVYRDNTVPYQSVLNARHIHVERALTASPRVPVPWFHAYPYSIYIYTCILPKKRKQNIRSRGHRSLPVLSLSLPRAQVFSFKQHAKDLEGGLISSGFNHGTFQIKIYVFFKSLYIFESNFLQNSLSCWFKHACFELNMGSVEKRWSARLIKGQVGWNRTRYFTRAWVASLGLLD